MMETSRTELTVFSKLELERMAKFAAKTRLAGSGMYFGNIGEQLVRWREDGGLDIITHHEPDRDRT